MATKKPDDKVLKPKKKAVVKQDEPIEAHVPKSAETPKADALIQKAEAPIHKPELKEEKKAHTPEQAAVAVKEPAKKGKKTAKAAKKKSSVKVVIARGKRKEAIARATMRPGKGAIRINKVLLDSYSNPFVRDIIREPLTYLGPEANTVNVDIKIIGGGMMGQAQAARTAIANALVEYFGDMNLKDKFVSIDRSLVVEDTRRVEPKKYRGPKARARYQKSYR